jgi:hypothetical protein
MAMRPCLLNPNPRVREILEQGVEPLERYGALGVQLGAHAQKTSNRLCPADSSFPLSGSSSSLQSMAELQQPRRVLLGRARAEGAPEDLLHHLPGPRGKNETRFHVTTGGQYSAFSPRVTRKRGIPIGSLLSPGPGGSEYRKVRTSWRKRMLRTSR